MILVTRKRKKIIGLEGFGLKIKKTRNNLMKKKKILIVVWKYNKLIGNGLQKLQIKLL